MSPLLLLPQLFRSRLTFDGGGATTAGAGKDSLAADEVSRGGDETGGATTLVVCESGTRELARSRGASLGAGATTFTANGFAAGILSRETSGAGEMGEAFIAGALRVVACETSGAGATTLVPSACRERLSDDCNSGAGATTLVASVCCERASADCNSGVGGTTLVEGNAGATNEERRPSAGGGPGLYEAGFDFSASRLATAESLCGSLRLGASTTFSTGLSPRATRMV